VESAVNQPGPSLFTLHIFSFTDDADVQSAVNPVRDEPGRAAKAEAVGRLLQRYGGEQPELRARIERCLLSIGDDIALIEAHVAPVDATLALLREHFSPRCRYIYMCIYLYLCGCIYVKIYI